MIQKNIRFSVIIPLYNKEKYIHRAINSVLSQTKTQFEVIIINDGSTDSSKLIASSFKDKRLYLINQENKGVSIARNTGIFHAKEENIVFLDADDEWMPDFLESLESLILGFPEARAFATSYLRLQSGKEPECPHFSKFPSESWKGIIENLFDVLATDLSPLTSSSICVKKEVFNQVGMFPEGIKRSEDIDMWIRIFLQYKIAFSTERKVIIHYDQEGSSLQLSGISNKNLYALLELEKKLYNNEIPKQLVKDAKRVIARMLGWEIDACIAQKEYYKACTYLLDKRMFVLPKKQIRLLIKLMTYIIFKNSDN